jgi:hypothetical protein
MKTFCRIIGFPLAVRIVAGLFSAALIAPVHAAPPTDPQSSDSPAMGRPMPRDASDAVPHQMPGMTPQQAQAMREMHAGQGVPMTRGMPAMAGQDAFGAIQEIVRALEADPKTNWSKVNLEALRQHLIDMDEVTLRADAETKPITGGVEIAVTGSGRTLAAIQRMVTAHAQEINGRNGWSAKTVTLPNGVLLTVTSNNPDEALHIRGLGFIGLLVTGSHHQPHHLAIAKGDLTHEH